MREWKNAGAELLLTADKEELFEVVFAPMDETVFNERIRNPAGGLKN